MADARSVLRRCADTLLSMVQDLDSQHFITQHPTGRSILTPSVTHSFPPSTVSSISSTSLISTNSPADAGSGATSSARAAVVSSSAGPMAS